jgi:hypothetical protein
MNTVLNATVLYNAGAVPEWPWVVILSFSMRSLSHLSIKSKLIVMLLAVSSCSILVTAYLGYRSGQLNLTDRVINGMNPGASPGRCFAPRGGECTQRDSAIQYLDSAANREY